jgi:protein Tex
LKDNPVLDSALRITQNIATEIQARPAQVASAITLLDEGATVPFIARYRKEVTGGLDDTQLRLLADRLGYLRELEARRKVILESIAAQDKLTDSLARDIARAETKAALEDIYLPYKPKRRTKAMIARENGLEPLLRAILDNRATAPEALAEGHICEAVPTVKAALDGARDILTEGAERECRPSGQAARLLARQWPDCRARFAGQGRRGREILGLF